MATHRHRSTIATGIVAALFVAAPLAAQGSGDEPSSDEEFDLVYERESFVYPANGRRDPFRPLVGGAGLGPRVEDLTVRGILYARDRSVALVADRSGQTYRLRRGHTIGRARVIEIRPSEVHFAVEEFGVVRQRVLELNREPPQGAGQ